MSVPNKEKIFLNAEWQDLLMLNYEVEPSLLSKYVPGGTQLDSFQGKTYVSLVGFRFCRTKFRGRIPLPFHSEFEEINLRFYVRRLTKGETRRGVVFIAEIVPKVAIAKTARWLYGENYVRRRTGHDLIWKGAERQLNYKWKATNGWCTLRADTNGASFLPEENSLQQFISEHYWGYSAQKDGTSLEYRVEHVPWRVWACTRAEFTGNPADLYGEEFSQILQKSPDSAFVAEGSAVSVYNGQKLL